MIHMLEYVSQISYITLLFEHSAEKFQRKYFKKPILSNLNVSQKRKSNIIAEGWFQYSRVC